MLLAQLLQERDIVSAPEALLNSKGARQMPDVLVDFSGLRTAIEGEVADQPNAEPKALSSAKRRVEQGIAQIGMAVVYPAELRVADFSKAKTAMQHARFRVAVVTESGPTGFTECSIDELAGILRRTFDQLVKEDAVSQAVELIESGIERFASAVIALPALVPRMAEVLGIRDVSDEKSGDSEEDE